MSSRDQFLVTVETSVLEHAAKNQVDCTVWDAGNDYVVQMQHVKDSREQGYDALIVNEVSPSLTRGILREAEDMPVVFVNREPEMSALTVGKNAYVGSDDSEPGRFQAGRSFDAIVAQNDEMAIGAAMAMQAAGKELCPILGIDGTIAGCQGIRDGMLSFTVRQPGDEQGRAAVDAALALIAGESLDTVSGVTLGEDGLSLMIPYEPVDAENVEEYIS